MDFVKTFNLLKPLLYLWKKEAESDAPSDVFHWDRSPVLDAFTAARGSHRPAKISHSQAWTFIHRRTEAITRQKYNMDDSSVIILDDERTDGELARIPTDTIVFLPALRDRVTGAWHNVWR